MSGKQERGEKEEENKGEGEREAGERREQVRPLPSASSSVMLVVLDGEGGRREGDDSSFAVSFFAILDWLCGTDSSMTNTDSCCCLPLGGSKGAASRCSKVAKDEGEGESGLPSGNGESVVRGGKSHCTVETVGE